MKSDKETVSFFKGARGLVIIGALLTGVVFMGIASPLHPLEMFVVLLLITLPLTLYAIHKVKAVRTAQPVPEKAEEMMIQVITREPFVLPRFSKNEWRLAIFIAVLLINAIAAINRFADAAPAKDMQAVVIGKHTSHQRHGEEYKVTIMSPAPSLFPAVFGNKENFTVLDYNQYHAVIPGLTIMDLQIHQGFFGFSWYNSNFKLHTPPHQPGYYE